MSFFKRPAKDITEVEIEYNSNNTLRHTVGELILELVDNNVLYIKYSNTVSDNFSKVVTIEDLTKMQPIELYTKVYNYCKDEDCDESLNDFMKQVLVRVYSVSLEAVLDAFKSINASSIIEEIVNILHNLPEGVVHSNDIDIILSSVGSVYKQTHKE